MGARPASGLVTLEAGPAADLLAFVKTLRDETQLVRLRNPRATSERVFRGPTLFAYARAAGLINRRSAGARFEASYFLLTASDGARVALAFSEVVPSLALKTIMLAHQQDGQPIQSGVRLVVPGDDLAGRSIVGVATIEAHEVPVEDVALPFALEGLLDRTGVLTPEALTEAGATLTFEANRHGVVTEPRQYVGSNLFPLLQGAGIQKTSASPEDFLGKVIVARGLDGYTAVVAGGEIDPHFQNGTVLVAAQRDGRPLPEGEGPVRLIVPHDRGPGRSIKQLARLEVIEG